MIHKNIKFTNLNPTLWAHLSHLLQCFFKDRVTLWVRLKNGVPIRAAIDNIPVPTPQELEVQALFTQYPQVQCIILAEEESLLRYYTDINSKIENPICADDYFSYTVQRLTQDDDIRYYLREEDMLPPPPWMDFYGVLKQIIQDNLPSTCTLLLEIMDDSMVWFQLAVVIRDDEILHVSTFDEFSGLLEQDTIIEPLTEEQLKKIKTVIDGRIAYFKVKKDDAILMLHDWIKKYTKNG